MNTLSATDRKLAQLLKDFGYEVQGNRLIQKGIRNWTSDRMVRTVRGLFDAAEMLIPIIADDDYHNALSRITRPTD